MKYIELVNIDESLKRIGNLVLPLKTGISITRFRKKIQPYVEEYYGEKDKLILSSCELQDDMSYKLKPENSNMYNEKMKELNNMEADIDLSTLEKIVLSSNLNLQPNDIMFIEDYIKVGDE